MTSPVTPLFAQDQPDAEADASRAAILDGALAAFLDVGIRRTSMGDVARRARISPATLYRKFAGKSGLVQAVGLREARRFLADMADDMEDVRRSGGDAEDQSSRSPSPSSTISGATSCCAGCSDRARAVLPVLTTQAARFSRSAATTSRAC